MLKHIFIINGKPRAGKDTAIDLMAKVYKTGYPRMRSTRHVRNISTVDPVKKAAFTLGWDGDKNPQTRAMLHAIKCAWDEGIDGSYKFIEMEARAADGVGAEVIMCVHCREPEKIARFKSELPFPVTTVLIKRDRSEDAPNYADAECENYEYDYTIQNIEGDGWVRNLTNEMSGLLDATIGGN